MHGDAKNSKHGDVKNILGVSRVSSLEVVVKETKLKSVIIKGDNRSFAEVVSRNSEKLVEVSSSSLQGRAMESQD